MNKRDIAAAVAAIKRNGVGPGGTVFMSVSTAVGILRDAGRVDDALDLVAQSRSNHVVRVKNGEMELVDMSEIGP